MCVNINLGMSSAGLPGDSGMAFQVRGVLKHPEHHARHATDSGLWTFPIIDLYSISDSGTCTCTNSIICSGQLQSCGQQTRQLSPSDKIPSDSLHGVSVITTLPYGQRSKTIALAEFLSICCWPAVHSGVWLTSIHFYLRDSLHTSQVSHLLHYPSLWLLASGLSGWFLSHFLYNLVLRSTLVSNISGEWLQDLWASETPVSLSAHVDCTNSLHVSTVDTQLG